MKPRHADLFATDLTDAQLLSYIDRLLMFYIKTADRLQRTATWMNNLEGGLDYLRDVIIHDSLGLGAELEAQMQLLIENYQCEWRTALNDPEQRARFNSYVNAAPPARSEFGFVSERGQLIPIRQVNSKETML